jgi:hypothetical protein
MDSKKITITRSAERSAADLTCSRKRTRDLEKEAVALSCNQRDKIFRRLSLEETPPLVSLHHRTTNPQSGFAAPHRIGSGRRAAEVSTASKRRSNRSAR